MTDRFTNNAASLEGPATHAFAITPNDAGDLAEITRGIFCGKGGTLAVTMLSGASITFQGIQDGTLLPIRAARVFATGTSASQLTGLA